MQAKELARLLSDVDGVVTARVNGDCCVLYVRGGEELIRLGVTPESGPKLSCGNLVLYVEEWRAFVQSKPVELTNAEFLTLRVLIRNAGITLARSVILDYTERDLDASGKAVDMTICRLRKKLRALGWNSKIVTVRKVGYRLTPKK